MGNLPKRVIGYLYKYFGMGGVPKIPLIKIGVGITGKGQRWAGRTVVLKKVRLAFRSDYTYFLASEK